MRVLHLPTQVGGNAWGLSCAERTLGIMSRVLYKMDNWLGYQADEVLNISRDDSNRYSIYEEKARQISKEYDVFHFNFGSTLLDFPGAGLDFLDLKYYEGKKCVVTYNGCDARQKFKRIKQADICACKYNECYDGICSSEIVDQKKERRIQLLHEAGFQMIALNPDLMNFLPEKTIFMPYTIANWDSISRSTYSCERGKTIKILHAPTNRVAKGSDIIIQTVKNLEQKYPGKLELILVEKIPHGEVLSKYEIADIVIDQIRIGWYGAFAVEVMKLGKPVMAYINEEDLHYIPEEMQKDVKEAIISVNETNLYEILEKIILDPGLLNQYYEAQQEYILKWHDPKKIAKKMIEIYNK